MKESLAPGLYARVDAMKLERTEATDRTPFRCVDIAPERLRCIDHIPPSMLRGSAR